MIMSCYSFSCYILTRADYRILTTEILFLTFELGPNIAFAIRNPILLSNSDLISHFVVRNPTLSFGFAMNIIFCHSKSYFDIRTGAEKLF